MRGTEAITGLMEARAGGGRGRQCLGVGGGEKWSMRFVSPCGYRPLCDHWQDSLPCRHLCQAGLPGWAKGNSRWEGFPQTVTVGLSFPLLLAQGAHRQHPPGLLL